MEASYAYNPDLLLKQLFNPNLLTDNCITCVIIESDGSFLFPGLLTPQKHIAKSKSLVTVERLRKYFRTHKRVVWVWRRGDILNNGRYFRFMRSGNKETINDPAN